MKCRDVDGLDPGQNQQFLLSRVADRIVRMASTLMTQAVLFGFVLACFFYLFTEIGKGPPRATA